MDCPPNICCEKLQVGDTEVFVVREDLLEGGTKERGALPYVSELQARGFQEFVYASPFSGFAQIALALACKNNLASCTLFAVQDPSAKGKQAHPYTLQAQSHGARILLAETLEEAETLASEYAAKDPSIRLKVPLGFDDPNFRKHFSDSLKLQWKRLEQELGTCPRSLWVSLGSGTLAGILRKIVPLEVQIHVMDVHVLPSTDARIQAVSQLPNVYYHSAKVEFCEPEELLPPIPSNRYYDAKVWATFARNAKSGDVWWNVAR